MQAFKNVQIQYHVLNVPLGLPLEWGFDGKQREIGAYPVRRSPVCHAHRVRYRVCPSLPKIQTEQARTEQHHRTGPAGPGAQRRDSVVTHRERGAAKQHELGHVWRGLPHGLPPAALRGHADEDHARCQPQQRQRRRVHQDRRPRSQTVSGAQGERGVCLREDQYRDTGASCHTWKISQGLNISVTHMLIFSRTGCMLVEF